MWLGVLSTSISRYFFCSLACLFLKSTIARLNPLTHPPLNRPSSKLTPGTLCLVFYQSVFFAGRFRYPSCAQLAESPSSSSHPIHTGTVHSTYENIEINATPSLVWYFAFLHARYRVYSICLDKGCWFQEPTVTSMLPESQAVLRRMQLTLYAIRPAPHSASRLVQAMPAVKTRRAPCRHCRDGRVYGHTTSAMHGMSTPPRGPLPLAPSRKYGYNINKQRTL